MYVQTNSLMYGCVFLYGWSVMFSIIACQLALIYGVVQFDQCMYELFRVCTLIFFFRSLIFANVVLFSLPKFFFFFSCNVRLPEVLLLIHPLTVEWPKV